MTRLWHLTVTAEERAPGAKAAPALVGASFLSLSMLYHVEEAQCGQRQTRGLTWNWASGQVGIRSHVSDPSGLRRSDHCSVHWLARVYTNQPIISSYHTFFYRRSTQYGNVHMCALVPFEPFIIVHSFFGYIEPQSPPPCCGPDRFEKEKKRKKKT